MCVCFFLFSGSTTGPVLMTHTKGTTCGQNVLVACGDGGNLRCPCCCNLPYLVTRDGTGQLLGRSRYLCDRYCCVPKWRVEDAAGNVQYKIRSDTCCLGCCVSCQCKQKGRSCFKVQFQLRDPKTNDKIPEAYVQDLWAGWQKECCTRQNYYSLRFPLPPPPP